MGYVVRDITPSMVDFQSEANQLSLDITEYFHQYESKSKLSMMTEAQMAQDDLQTALQHIHAVDVELWTNLWLTGSSYCFEKFTEDLNVMIKSAGVDISSCSEPHGQKLEEVTRAFFEHYRQYQFIPVDLQTLSITGLNGLNPLSNPDITFNFLHDSLVEIHDHFYDEVQPDLKEHLIELEASLEEIYTIYNECMSAPKDLYDEAAAHISAEIKACSVYN